MNMEGLFPKNLRQIGEIPRDKKIYIEDYVMTRITKANRGEEQPVWYGLLLGNKEEIEGSTCFFADGLLEISTLDMDEEELERVNQEKNTYFQEKEFLGVALICGQPIEEEELLWEKLQVFCSAQDEAIIYQFQEQDMEEHLFVLQQLKAREVSGYYVYYAENAGMQEYMAVHSTENAGEGEADVSDAAIEKFRKKVAEKLEQKKQAAAERPAKAVKMKKLQKPHVPKLPKLTKWNGVMRGAASAAAIALMIACAALIQNNSRMREMEDMLDQYAAEAEAMARNNAALQSENMAIKENQAAVRAASAAAETAEDTDTIPNAGAENAAADLSADGTAPDSAQTDDGTQSGQDQTGSTGAADSAKTNGSAQPDTEQSGSAQPDTEQPGSAQLDAEQTGSAQLDAEQPGSAQLDAEQTGSAQLDAEQSGSAQANAGQPSGSAQANADQSAVSARSGAGQSDSGGQTGVNQSDNSAQARAGQTADSDQSGSSQTAQQTDETVPTMTRPVQSSYTIKAGDTLADICTAYYGDISRLEEICELNHIADGNVVIPGQKIVLP